MLKHKKKVVPIFLTQPYSFFFLYTLIDYALVHYDINNQSNNDKSS